MSTLSRTGVLSLVPNVLTVARILLAAAFPFVPPEWRIPALATALVTEYLDGALARRFGWTSRFGRVLDPIADRCVFLAVAITLLVDGTVTAWQLAALGARDVLVAVGALWIAARGRARRLQKLHPRAAGKVTTALQYAALFCVLLGLGLPAALLAGTAALGLLASAQYFADARKAGA